MRKTSTANFPVIFFTVTWSPLTPPLSVSLLLTPADPAPDSGAIGEVQGHTGQARGLLQKQGRPLSSRLLLLEEISEASDVALEPLSQGRDVVAGVQDVGHSALPLLLPQLVGVGWERRLPPLSPDLQCDSTDSQHPPRRQDDEVVGLERRSDDSPSEVHIESPPEDVQSDVGQARGHVTANSQHHRVGAHDSTGQDVQYSEASHEDNRDEQGYAGKRHPEHAIVTENSQVSQRSEENSGGDEEAQHEAHAQHTERDGPKSPPGGHQEDPTDAASYSCEDQANVVLKECQPCDQDVKEESQEDEADKE